ncbi:carbohydrate ABC transporter permease [Aestuariimicrobium kwangyangense]|uniref:carbohydrate ABC transporter permease n=1 Tax=Aestuariimicrobium kwangyangense TaxID=396389 RepID=UPI0003B48C04|nr:sugar ABC transporter permease [Aestuariimicrobium kwangyangense]
MTVAAPAPTTAHKRPYFASPRNRRDALIFTMMALPNVALIAAFTYRPLIVNLQYSTLDWQLGSRTATVIGLNNYVEWFTSGDAALVLRTTGLFALATVGGSMLLGLLVALALNTAVPGRTFARATVFAPYVLSGVGVGLIWSFIFDPTYGVLSFYLRGMGLSSPQWFSDPGLSLVMVIIVYVWKNLGYCAVVYLAGLQSMPSDVMEAASIDGASGWSRFRHMTLPLLGPTTLFLTITTILNSLQAFDLIKIMTPASDGTRVLIYEAYLQAFGAYQRAGYSAAISVILFVILLALTVIQLAWVEKKVHYA